MQTGTRPGVWRGMKCMARGDGREERGGYGRVERGRARPQGGEKGGRTEMNGFQRTMAWDMGGVDGVWVRGQACGL